MMPRPTGLTRHLAEKINNNQIQGIFTKCKNETQVICRIYAVFVLHTLENELNEMQTLIYISQNQYQLSFSKKGMCFFEIGAQH